MILENHALAIFWLERRIQFLNTLNEMVAEEVPEPEIEFMAQQFSRVENVKDLHNRLQEIYGKDFWQ